MEIAAIQEALHRQPFRPFSMRLVDGSRLHIPHRDFVAVSTRRVVVINPQGESTSILEPLLILAIDYPADSAATTSQQGNSG